ncbi:MAG: hypothetical protein ACRCUJ_14230 [Phocaeicola sp.]
MSVITFSEVFIPVPTVLIPQLKRFSDGLLSIQGVRVTVKSMKLHFQVFNWNDLTTLAELKVPVGSHFDYFKAKDCGNGHKFLLNAIKRINKQPQIGGLNLQGMKHE